jgi:hypothetical protein
MLQVSAVTLSAGCPIHRALCDGWDHNLQPATSPLPLPSLGLSAEFESPALNPKDNEKTKSRKDVG